MLKPHEIRARLERILPAVQKPGRYTGGELNQIVKDWGSVRTRVALVFPEIYDLGMANLGLAILYDELNKRPDVLAERAYCPWSDMESAMRQAEVPLFSLESKHSLAQFDIVGFSLPTETLYTNLLNALDLAGIPLFSEQRSEMHPLIIAGGHATYNPEPVHAFIDAFVIGEGEEVIAEIVETHQRWRAQPGKLSRAQLLRDLARLPGVYVPSLYQAVYHEDGTFARLESLPGAAPLPVVKRIVASLPPPPTRFVVPYIDTVHNRAVVEIMRGCTRGCRFCHAGMVNRPVRERPVEQILAAIDDICEQTGFEEIGLLSLSSSDYTQRSELVEAAVRGARGRHLGISLPSLRIDTVSVDLMQALQEHRRTGFTLAPEAATERMRSIINKPVSEEKLLATARAIFSRGWTTVKLYFMIGLPSETLEDVQAIVELCKKVRSEGRQAIGRRAVVHAGVSTFVPKAHTPFQWAVCDSMESIREKQALLRRQMSGEGLKITWTSPEETHLEAWMARGDRRLSEVIYGAWKRGARFDAWIEHFNFDAWLQAFAAAGLDPEFYTRRERPLTEVFPWEHISTGVRKRYLQEDYQLSLRGELRRDCRSLCTACGILPLFAAQRRAHPEATWMCPVPASAPLTLPSPLRGEGLTSDPLSLKGRGMG